jgi:hypothetical protein
VSILLITNDRSAVPGACQTEEEGYGRSPEDKAIAGRLVMDVERSFDDKERPEAYNEQLWLYHWLLGQKTIIASGRELKEIKRT